VRITGQEIKRLRNILDMSVLHFSELIGVHLATVYRWESFGNKAPPLGPLHQRILEHLKQQLGMKTHKGSRFFADELRRALLEGGTLVALAYLLASAGSQDRWAKRRP